MCDFSLESYKSRRAEKGDRLVTYRFPTGSVGMCRAGEHECPTCIQPGTELAFDHPIVLGIGARTELKYCTATFMQLEHGERRPLDVSRPMLWHRDGIETPDGEKYSLQTLAQHQTLTVLQVPAELTVEDMARELGLAPVTRPAMVAPCYSTIKEMTRDAARMALADARR